MQPPLRETSCGVLQTSAATEGPFRPKGDFARQMDRQTDKQKDNGIKREFDFLQVFM